MNKRVFPFMVFLIIFFLIFSYTTDKNKGSYIKLDNKTDQDLENLKIKSDGLEEDIKIDFLGAGEFKEFELDFKKEPFEASIQLIYFDKDKNDSSEDLISYFESGEKIQKRFTIVDISNKGKLDIKENNYGLIH